MSTEAPKAPHPLDFLPRGNTPALEGGQQLRHLAQGRSPFLGMGGVDDQQNAAASVNPWLKTVTNAVTSYLGMPTVDFGSIMKRPAFTGGSIGRSPSPEFAAAAQRVQNTPAIPQFVGIPGALQSFANSVEPGSTGIPFELLQQLPGLYQQLQAPARQI